MSKLDQFEIEVPEGTTISFDKTATGLLNRLAEEQRKHVRDVYYDKLRKLLCDRPMQEAVLPPQGMSVVPIWDTSDDVVTEIQTRKPELTTEQKRMGLRSRRFIDQPEWTDWD